MWITITFWIWGQGFINECGYLVVHNSDIDGERRKVRILKPALDLDEACAV